MALDGLMYISWEYTHRKRSEPQILKVHTTDAYHRDCKYTWTMRITTWVPHRRMHYSPLLYGTYLLWAAPPLLSVSRGDPLLLSAGQPSSHAVNMRLTDATSAGLCVVVCQCRPCRHPCAFYCKIKDIFLPGQTSDAISSYGHHTLNGTHSHFPLLLANCRTHL